MNSQHLMQKDELNESWVDVNGSSNGQGSPKNTENLYTPLNIEKLLLDAQRESGQNSEEGSARTSPKALDSPTGHTTQDGLPIPTDWMWDWSSGPEKNAGEQQVMKLKTAVQKRQGYSLRNSKVMKPSVFNRENLTILLASHLSAFVVGIFFGAAGMYILSKSEQIPIKGRS